MLKTSIKAALIAGAAFTFSQAVTAASCCGGGSASSLLMPKFSKGIIDLSMDYEQYDGYWNTDGNYTEDPPGSDLSQWRLNLGYGLRLADRWQASVILPYVWNDNQYSGINSQTSGVGDTTINLWYEGFDNVTCVWKIRKPEDWLPASYYGLSMVLPTGTSPYQDVDNSFDITGRGFYRVDANLLIDKTIYPWNASFAYSYGVYLERSVNQEYGKYLEPYDKQLGNRQLMSLSGGYTQFLDNMDTLTYTVAYSDLREGDYQINDVVNKDSGMRKRSAAFTLAYSTMDRDWVFKLTMSANLFYQKIWGDDERLDDGENFPATDVITVGVSHVLR